MTIRNFDRLFSPRSVVLIGASDTPGSVGRIVGENLLSGGFRGPIWFINPRRSRVLDQTCYASVGELPATPDLAVIATPPATIPTLIAELGGKGTRAAVVITAGIRGEVRQQMLDAARPHLLRIQGPNCLGLMLPPLGLNASFARGAPQAGDLALVSQSGALITAIVDWAAGRGIGFSHVVSLGDMADADFGDLLDYLAGDVKSRAILLYMEALTNAPKFMSAARRAARAKPVIAIKAGRMASGAKAAFSHTGALAGSDQAYEVAFRRAGVLRVHELEHLFEAAEILSRVPRLSGERLMIVTNGGGAGVLAADRLAELEGTLATVDPGLLAELDAVLPPTWSRANPVDIIGDAGPERIVAALTPILRHDGTDAILSMHCPTALAASDAAADAVLATIAADAARDGAPQKPVLTCWLGEASAAAPRRKFAASGIATFETPSAAVQGFLQIVRHRRAQDELMRTPPAMPADLAPPDSATVSRILSEALARGTDRLDEADSKTILKAYGIPVAETFRVTTPEEAESRAAEILRDYSNCVLKIVSEDIPHKSDLGGVKLGLASPSEVREAARAMLASLAVLRPQARLQGFTVQPMIERRRAHELIVGMTEDATFGPLLLFGAGGTSVEVVADTAAALPPLDLKLANDLIAKTRISRLLAGYRDRPAADREAIALALVRTSMLVANHSEIRELDINPLVADEKGVIALDARVRIADATLHPRRPMSIRPYPSDWEKSVSIDGIGELRVRPIRPEDERLYAGFVERLEPGDIRMRLLAPVRELSHAFVARLTQIDYAREMAFVAVDPAEKELLGVVRLHADPDYVRAEYAAIVRSDLKGRGLGWQMMEHLIAYARAEGIAELHGDVLAENTTMLAMCRALGFDVAPAPDDPALRRVVLHLAG
ncbi:MAG TPA: bifunctional acetate--CoA ligase family protein/GNAT family N-acetyltransferase [Hyphomicrobiaceae bacterium]|nr:bifunctional acetate--CoA ligase family protein/GNAT family N-acetyltransferase [Hyphomicrobiaceae bacterium]